MSIQFLKEWRVYRPGQVTDAIPAGVVDLLLKRGIAQPAPVAKVVAEPDETPPAEPTDSVPPTERDAEEPEPTPEPDVAKPMRRRK